MSPVSRGRGKKNRSSKGPKGRQAPVRGLPAAGTPGPQSWPAPGLPPQTVPRLAAEGGNREQRRHASDSTFDALAELARRLPGASQIMSEARAWWADSHVQVLDDVSELLSCAGPVELEDTVCDLLGRHWRSLHERYSTGVSSQEWLEALLEAAGAHAGEPAVRRLIYGIAVIATPGLASLALQLLADAPVDDAEPAWLATAPTVTASPEVQLLRDVYGLRFGLLAEVTGPGGWPRTYLFDIDLCHGFYQVLDSGYYPDAATAAAAWRAGVGVSAKAAEPAPAPADLLPHVLPGGGLIDELFGQPLSDSHFRELYRGDRIVFAISDAYDDAGHPIQDPPSDPGEAARLAGALTGRFRAWAATTGVDLPPDGGPDDDVVGWLLNDWVSPGLAEDLSLACSPHRIAAFTAYVVDDWQPGQRERGLAVLEAWARFCLEHGRITGEAAEQTLAWARRAAAEPETVGGDLGNHLNRPIDETTVTGPALHSHAG